MKRFQLCAWTALLLFVTAGTVLAADTDPLGPLNFLLGKWEGVGSGKPGEGGGTAEFYRHLQGHVIIRNSTSDYPATPTRPAYSHTDLMIIYADASKTFRADYYDNEGHVIRYTIHVGPPNEATFVSDAAPKDPRYRLTYTLNPNGTLDGKFEIAPPDHPEAFGAYLTWTTRKMK
jgi:hypothetical protein